MVLLAGRLILRLHQARAFHGSYNFVSLKEPLLSSNECQCQINNYNTSLPPDCQLDASLPLPKKSPEYQKQLLLLSSNPNAWNTDWESKLELSKTPPYSLLSELKTELSKAQTKIGILINAICFPNRPSIEHHKKSDTDVHFLVIPDFRIYSVGIDKIKDFAAFVSEGATLAEGCPKISFNNYKHGADHIHDNDVGSVKVVESKNYPRFEGQKFDRDLILVCGHMKRDARCGLIASDLVAELTQRDLPGNAEVAITSHIGGHKFAGNLIWYRRLGTGIDGKPKVDGIWFGKVLPYSVPTLVSKFSQGEIIKDFYRGGISNRQK
ncbi:HFL266Wp [Eremothecium sinecaudum]|uniref:Altered inheritance of mitochondria protein 32 n=1 Tax=Eremothecium sinecaudum TaxID=45286 RepID=A0A0X8HUC6_9SACH|nr:HFL266Wp [Eremothecium sinecaudum]AMD21590.1 HFL266Wp [Eremothecium sinecaudum]